METTLDNFLGGRIVCAQPKKGFRAGHDTVLLAAAVPARAGDHVLELGSGAGIASLCLAARVAGVDTTGIEIDPELVAVANANAERNGMAGRVRFVQGDIVTAHITGAPFDRAFFNPPFHPDTGQASPSAGRDRAMRGDDIAKWMDTAMSLVAAGGTVTAILRADRIDEVEGAMTVLPLVPREGEPAKRAILQIRKHSDAPSRTLAPMILHRAEGGPTDAAEAVLRHAQAIIL